MDLPFPMKGVSDLLGVARQSELTSRSVLNMRGIDPVTDRARGAQRAGLSRFMSDVLVSADPIKAMDQVTYSNKPLTYAEKGSSLGASDCEWTASTPSKLATPAIKVDRQGNVYAVDGLSGVAKFNSAGTLQWKIALPVDDELGSVRALDVATVGFVDGNGDAIYAGVSAGGEQSAATMFCYKQITALNASGAPEIKTEQVWKITPGAFTEMMQVRNSLLYCAQNQPETGQAFLRVYTGINTANPVLAGVWEIPFPVNCLDVNTSDGSVLTAHEPNASRGINPQFPGYTARDLARDWSLNDLTDVNKRLWCDLDAATIGVSQELSDGDSVSVWPDDGPGGRVLFQATAANQPVYIENGINGLPVIRFNGATALTQSLISLPNPSIAPTAEDQQRTTVPASTNCRWAMFMVLKPALENTIRPLFHRDNTVGGASSEVDVICLNRDSTSATIGTGTFSGKLALLVDTDATNGPGAGSAGGFPFNGDYAYSASTGAVILTILHDGNNSPTVDQAQHGFLRVNGRPVDRYVNLDSSGIGVVTIGGPGTGALTTYLNADIARIIVLRDYDDGGLQGNPATGNYSTVGGTGNFHYPRTVGALGASANVLYEAVAGNRYNDNEIERIEGMLAGEYGLAHVLPCGTAAVLTFTANAAGGNTVTIDGVVYTFRAALTVPAVANEILIGGNARATATNLFRAINNTGAIGTDYSNGTVAHPTCRATAFNNDAGAVAKLKIETKGLTAVAVADNNANMAWNVATTTTLATDASSANNYMPGHYPHPFNIHFGFPRKDEGATIGVTIESRGKMLNSTEGILAKWNPNGKLAWVFTSRLATVTPAGTLPATDQKFGGIGYGCVWGTGTDIYTCGPMYSTAPGTSSEQASLRRIIDATTSATVTGTGTWALTNGTLVGAGAADSMDYAYPRMAVDTFDNVYLPWYEDDAATGVSTLVGVKASSAVMFNFEINNGTTNPAGYACVVDPKLPEYQGDPVTRAFAVYVGTKLGYTVDLAGQATIYKVNPVSTTGNQNSPRTTKYVGVSAGEVMTFTSAGPVPPSGSGTLTGVLFQTTPTFVSMASLFGEIFMTDGRRDLVYKAREDKVEAWASTTGGDMKARARLLCAWRGRMVRARFADDPHEWQMSALGNPRDFDINPPLQLPTQAVLGTQSPGGVGKVPDIVNALCPYSDNELIFFCQSSIHVLRGDPMDGGRMVLVSDSTGGSFGNSWCKDENGVVYFHGTRGAIYMMRGPGAAPVDISSEAIPARLRTIDLTVNRIELRWNHIDQGLHVFVIPYDSTLADSATEHYFWSANLKAWWPDTFGSDGMQPCSTMTLDGDSDGELRMVIGGTDGYVRVWDAGSKNDDDVAVDARVLIGPLAPEESPFETRFTGLRALLPNNQEGCTYRFFATDTPDVLGVPVFTGTLSPGRNGVQPVRAVGSYVAMELVNAAPGERFAIESLAIDAAPAGRKRVRT